MKIGKLLEMGFFIKKKHAFALSYRSLQFYFWTFPCLNIQISYAVGRGEATYVKVAPPPYCVVIYLNLIPGEMNSLEVTRGLGIKPEGYLKLAPLELPLLFTS